MSFQMKPRNSFYVIKRCRACNKEFESRKKTDRISCSKECGYKARIITKNSGQYQKGNKPWNTGGFPEHVKKKLSESRMKSKYRTGKNHPRWKGGIQRSSLGYIHQFCPGSKANRRLQHRIVVEQYLGRKLTSKEVVHHIGAKDDNRIEMLIVFKNNSVHMKYHGSPDSVDANDIVLYGPSVKGNKRRQKRMVSK